MKGLPVRPKQVSTPAPVLDLMSALKRSLAQEPGTPGEAKTQSRRRPPANQLVVAGARKEGEENTNPGADNGRGAAS